MARGKIILPIFVLLLAFAGFLISREDLWNREKTSIASSSGPFFKELNIEAYSHTIPAPDFTLEDLRGERLSLRDLRGKVVFLNFWATWCPSCNLEMPSMEALRKELGDEGLVILAVNLREGADEVRTFFRERQLSFTALLDQDGETFARYEAWSLPTTYLIGKNGELLGKVVGYRDWESDEAMNFFRRLLKNNA